MYERELRTVLQGGNPQELQEKRCALMKEAFGWEPGTFDSPAPCPVESLPDRTPVYFLKPGAKAGPGSAKPHDMTPVVGDQGYRPGLGETWAELGHCGHVDRDAFTCMLVLVYRNAYLLDYNLVEGVYRYSPSGPVRSVIEALAANPKVQGCFTLGVLGFLHFLNLFG